jgi:hypothetical protein
MGWWVVVCLYSESERAGLDWTGLLLMQWTVLLKALHIDTYLTLPTCSVSLSAFHIAEREIEVFGCQSLFDLHLNI